MYMGTEKSTGIQKVWCMLRKACEALTLSPLAGKQALCKQEVKANAEL